MEVLLPSAQPEGSVGAEIEDVDRDLNASDAVFRLSAKTGMGVIEWNNLDSPV